ncbi:MAG: signal transduction histidine kinase [Gammaproteobacteria bacterium]|jgi:signal transduction histidine kinase
MTNAPPPESSDFDASVLVRRMGHDFNNLLSIVLGGLSLLREELPESAWDNDSEEIFADVISATREAASVIAQLTAWAARQSIEPQDTNINDVAVQGAELLRRALPPSINLELAAAEEPVIAWVDRTRLLDALLEIAANARDAMPNGGTLRISTTSDDEIGLQVHDTGEGMDEQTRLQCKQPYFTTRASGTRRGFGLSVIDGFMRASNGRLQIASKPNQGTSVTLGLPAARGLS